MKHITLIIVSALLIAILAFTGVLAERLVFLPSEEIKTPKTPLIFGDTLVSMQREMSKIYRLAEAIARQEGYYKDGSRSQRNNNPGNLKAGCPCDSQKHTVYDTPLEGWNSLYWYLLTKEGMTLEQIGKTYAEDFLWATKVKMIHHKLYGINPEPFNLN